MRTVTIVPIALALLTVAAGAQAPSPPGTGPFTVQMFVEGTRSVMIAVFPPTTYADGTAIPTGTPVQIKVYRSLDGGASYGQSVLVVSGGEGYVGQGEAGSRRKPWIDMRLQTGVDNREPYLVYLAASAVVNGVEGLATTANLTFRYFPELVRFATPEAAGGGGAGTGGLEGTWDWLPDGGRMTLRRSGNRIQGTWSQAGETVQVSGTVRGRTYDLTLTIADTRVPIVLVLSADGRQVTSTVTLMDATTTSRFAVRGRSLVRL